MAGALTAKQEAFCQGLLDYSRAEAYRRAYATNGAPQRAADEAWKLLQIPDVARRYNELRLERDDMVKANKLWSFEKSAKFWLQLATYDPAELTKTIHGACHYCHGDGHEYQWREPDFMDAMRKVEGTADPLPEIAGGFGYNALREPHPDCPKCDGAGLERTMITPTDELSPAARAAFMGVKETRNGIEVLMADRAKAAERLDKLFGLDVERRADVTAEQLPENIAKMPAEEAAKIYERFMRGDLTQRSTAH